MLSIFLKFLFQMWEQKHRINFDMCSKSIECFKCILRNENSTLYLVVLVWPLAWGTKVNSVQWTSIFHKFLYKNYFPQNCVEVFKLISFVLVETQYFQFLLLLKFVLVDKFD
jgi:hypothetical protein